MAVQAETTATGVSAHVMTEENLKSAFAGESQAHVRYLVYAEKARAEGRPNIGRLFEALSYAEFVHASKHLRALDQIGATTENLKSAIKGETFEVQEMYPAYIEVAKLQAKPQAERSMFRALEAEKVHARMYSEAAQALEAGGDYVETSIHICAACGWTVEGDAPDKCPLCGAPRERFRRF